MTRSVHEVIWGYEDTILADVIDKVLEFVSKFTKEPLPLPPSFIQLQSNNTPVIWHNYSEIYTGKVCLWINGILGDLRQLASC